jgi:hypothetical protein
VQHKFRCVNLINESWMAWTRVWITPTHLVEPCLVYTRTSNTPYQEWFTYAYSCKEWELYYAKPKLELSPHIERYAINLTYVTSPGLDHIFIWLGPAPPMPSSLSGRSSCPHLRGNSSSLGTDVTTPSTLGIVTLVLDEEEFPHKCGQEDHALKEAWKGQGPTEIKCDLA